MTAFIIHIGYQGIQFNDLGTRVFSESEVVDLIADEGFSPSELNDSLELADAIGRSIIYAEDEDGEQIESAQEWYFVYISDTGNIPTDTGIIVTRGNVTKLSITKEKITRVDYPNGDYKTFTYDNDFKYDQITEVFGGITHVYQLGYDVNGRIDTKTQIS